MILAPGSSRLHARDDLRRRLDAPALETVIVEHTRPRIENLHDIGAGPDLRHEIVDRRLDQRVDQAPGRHPDRLPRTPAPAPDPAFRDRRSCRSPPSTAPRRSRSATFPAAACPAPAPPSPGPAEAAPRRMRLRDVRCLLASIGSRRGPSPSTKSTRRPSAYGTTRISEKRIAASISKRSTGCSVISAARSGSKQRSRKLLACRAHRPILRQIASGLPHQPDRRRRKHRSIENLTHSSAWKGDAFATPRFFQDYLVNLLFVSSWTWIAMGQRRPLRSSSGDARRRPWGQEIQGGERITRTTESA